MFVFLSSSSSSYSHSPSSLASSSSGCSQLKCNEDSTLQYSSILLSTFVLQLGCKSKRLFQGCQVYFARSHLSLKIK